MAKLSFLICCCIALSGTLAFSPLKIGQIGAEIDRSGGIISHQRSTRSSGLHCRKLEPICRIANPLSSVWTSRSKLSLFEPKFATPTRMERLSAAFERSSTSFRSSVDSHPLSWEEIMGAKPDGPDPIQFTQSDMRLLKKRIKGVIERNLGSGDSTHPLLKSSSKDFFERAEKAWRPMMTLLLSSAIAELKAQQQQQHGAAPSAHHDDAMTVSEIVEIMHTSTLIHDTVLEEYEALEKGNVAHRLYSSSLAGNKVSILAGDFLLSRASVLLASLRRTQIVEIMAGALEAIMKGQMQLHRPMQQELTIAQYVRNIELRTATLLASGCECAAIVSGFERGSAVATAAFEYGRHVGIAYQLVSDLQATQGNFEKLLRKMEACVLEDGRTSDCSFDPYELNEPLQRAGALIFAAERDPALAAQVQQGFGSVEDLMAARDAIDACFAVEEVSALAARHARQAVDALAALPASGPRDALALLAHYVVEPEQSRLKRANYKEGVFVEPAAPSRRDRIRSTLTNARKGAKIGLFSMREQVKEGLQRVTDSVQQMIQGI